MAPCCRLVLSLLVGAGLGSSAAAQGGEPGAQARRRGDEGWRRSPRSLCALPRAGRGGQSGRGGPAQGDGRRVVQVAEGGASFVATVKTAGRSVGCPDSTKVIDDAQTNAIFAYVKGRADGKISAGRPQRTGG